jgi:hypothetical protein
MKNRGNKGGSMRAFSGASLALTAMLALGSIVTSTACTQVGVVKARRSLKQANQEYAQQNYKKASELYEETLAENPNEPFILVASKMCSGVCTMLVPNFRS